jgi:WD40 repeat protein
MFGDGNRVQILEASTGKEIISLPNEYRVISVAFSPDGKYIVLSGEDNSFHIWEIQSGKEVSRNSFLEDTINKIIFSPDGEYVLLNYGFDEKILAQPWKINDLISETCKRLPRNFTHDEWNQYIGDASPYQAVCPDLTIEPEITPTP